MALFFEGILLCVCMCGYSFAPLAYRSFFLGCLLCGIITHVLVWHEPWGDGVACCVLILGAHVAASAVSFFGVSES